MSRNLWLGCCQGHNPGLSAGEAGSASLMRGHGGRVTSGDQAEDQGKIVAHIGHAPGPQFAGRTPIARIAGRAVNPVLRRHQPSQGISGLVIAWPSLREAGALRLPPGLCLPPAPGGQKARASFAAAISGWPTPA